MEYAARVGLSDSHTTGHQLLCHLDYSLCLSWNWWHVDNGDSQIVKGHGQVGNSHGLWYTCDYLGGKRDGAGVRSFGVNGKNHGLGPAWETTSDRKIIDCTQSGLLFDILSTVLDLDRK